MEASSTSAPQLRPLGVGEILDASFKLYKSHFKTLVLCLLVLTVPVTVLQTLVTLSVDPEAFDYEKALDPQAQPATTDVDTAALAAQGIGGLILLVLAIASFVACFRAVSTAYLAGEADWKASLRFGMRKLLRVVWLTVLATAIFTLFWAPIIAFAFVAPILLLLLFVWIPLYVWLLVRLSMAVPVGLFEDVTGPGAFRRSFELVKGRWWPTFGTLVIMYLLTFVLQLILAILLIAPAFAGAGNELLGAVLTTLANILSYTLTLPLLAAAWVVTYYDLRVRREGFDLAMVAERFGESSPSEVAHSSGLGGYDPSGPAQSPPTFGGFSAPRAPDEPDTRA